MRSPADPRRRRAALGLVAAFLLLLIGGAAYCAHLGYPGGPLYKLVPASAAPAPADRGTVAVFLSGDMGFNTGMGPKIAARIAAQGIPVLGVNSLSAFAHRRSPAQTTALIRDAIGHALSIQGTRRVVLIGHSFGAGALIEGAGGLPPPLRARVAMIALIVPPDTLALQTVPGGIIGLGSDGPALPPAKALDWVPTVCIHGDRETGSLCPTWHQANVTGVALPGDHFLHHDTSLVATTVLRALATLT